MIFKVYLYICIISASLLLYRITDNKIRNDRIGIITPIRYSCDIGKISSFHRCTWIFEVYHGWMLLKIITFLFCSLSARNGDFTLCCTEQSYQYYEFYIWILGKSKCRRTGKGIWSCFLFYNEPFWWGKSLCMQITWLIVTNIAYFNYIKGEK